MTNSAPMTASGSSGKHGMVWMVLVLIALVAVACLGWFVLGRTAVATVTVVPMAALSPIPDDEIGLRTISRDPAWLERGRQVYQQLCWNCHGREGEGGQGPNLRDGTWIVEPTMLAIRDVIRNGKPGTAMQAMRDWYSDEEITAVAAFVADLHRHPGPAGTDAEGLHGAIDW